MLSTYVITTPVNGQNIYLGVFNAQSARKAAFCAFIHYLKFRDGIQEYDTYGNYGNFDHYFQPGYYIQFTVRPEYINHVLRFDILYKSSYRKLSQHAIYDELQILNDNTIVIAYDIESLGQTKDSNNMKLLENKCLSDGCEIICNDKKFKCYTDYAQHCDVI
jgi:hypothetical protein